jgi:hypothetical protein
MQPGHADSTSEKLVVMVLVVAALSAAIGGVVELSVEGPCPSPNGSSSSGFVPAPPTVWDEQATLSFSTNSTSLYTNVTVSAPEDQYGYGPGFLLNGATDLGYWYQVGIVDNWGVTAPMSGHNTGFELVTSVFVPGDQATAKFKDFIPVEIGSGSTVRLGLELTAGCVVMSWTLPGGEVTTENYDAFGSTSFVNNSPYPNDSAAFESSLMTEWWHVDPYFGPTANATYTMPRLSGSFVGMGLSERVPGTDQMLFGHSLQAHLGCDCTTQLDFQNATEKVNTTSFTTG